MYEDKPLTWAQMYSDLFRDFQLEPGEIAEELGLDEADFNKIVKGARKPDEKETDRFLKLYLGRYKRYEEYKDPDRRRDLIIEIISSFTSSEQETETPFPTKLPGKGTLKKGPVKEKKRPAEK